jgi:N-acetylglucosamine PTS system EIICBA or EIICB component
MLGFLQKIGKSMMLPIATLPAAALLLRLGQPDLLNIKFIADSGNAVFANLALIFAIGVAIGFSKDGNGAAALAGAIGYFVLTNGAVAINKDINLGVLGGIIAGISAGLLYNRFHNVKLPEWLAFFGGKRFVPIVTSGAMVVLAFIFGYVWPTIQTGINDLGQWIIGAGALGVGVYGFLNRLLIPLGLHHVLNSLVWFEFGTYKGVHGDLTRFFKGDPTAGTFMVGFFPIMMFGLPAAALAMIAAAKKEKRKQVAGLLLGIAFTSFLTGVTEPIEFAFMFLAPLLYGVHALLTASSMVVTYLLGIKDGFGFSAGAIDYVLNFNIATKPLLLLFIGIIYGIIYFVLFYFLIKKFDIKTPGREDDTDDIEENVSYDTDDKFVIMASQFMDDLGGKANIESIDNCATRLRLVLSDTEKVNQDGLKRHGARGVVKLNKKNLQVIVGTQVEFVAEALKNLKNSSPVSVKKVNEKKATNVPKETFSREALKGNEFVAPVKGKIVPISEVPDDVFSTKMMGDGFAIKPVNGLFVSPVDGEITTVFPTKHAIGITSKQGYEVLIHVGLETVDLKGEGFEVFVQVGDSVKKGQKLLKVDIEDLKKKVPSVITPVVFTNLDANQSIKLTKLGEVQQGDEAIIEII